METKNILRDEVVLRRRGDFPFLSTHPELVYFDNAATTQKPQSVLWSQQNWYQNLNSNPLRGMYDLSAKATAQSERARALVASFIGANTDEIIFTSGATMGLNFLALMQTANCQKGDEILVSVLEHHANLLPWQELARRNGARLVYIEPDENGFLSVDALTRQMSTRTKIVALTGMSNVVGNPPALKHISQLIHKNNALFFVDGAQLIAHQAINVHALDIDALSFSGHKLYGPMGIGVLYLRRQLAEQVPPIFVGGEMISEVTRDHFTLAPIPQRFEAGTVNAAGAVGLAKAIEYVQELGMNNIAAREQELTMYLLQQMQSLPAVQILGSANASDHCGLVSFNLADVHAHDVATILASEGIAVRAGHHCAAVLHQFFGVPASVRVSLSWYNTRGEIDKFIRVLATVRGRMGYE